jgi:hypothetical protein
MKRKEYCSFIVTPRTPYVEWIGAIERAPPPARARACDGKLWTKQKVERDARHAAWRTKGATLGR